MNEDAQYYLPGQKRKIFWLKIRVFLLGVLLGLVFGGYFAADFKNKEILAVALEKGQVEVTQKVMLGRIHGLLGQYMSSKDAKQTMAWILFGEEKPPAKEKTK